MGAVKNFLFGSKPKYETKTVQTLLPEQQELLTSLINVISPQLGGSVPAYEGELVAPLSPLQQSVLESAQSMVEPLSSLFSQGLQTFSSSTPAVSPSSEAKGASYWKGLMTAFTPEPWDKSEAEEYWRKAFVAPAEQQYWQQIVPQLSEKFAGSNAIDSSAFARAMTSSGANLATDLGSELAKTIMQDREAWRNFYLGTLGAGTDLARTVLGDITSARDYSLGQQKLGLARQELGLRATEDALNQLMNLSNLGDIERQVNQAQLQADYKKWLQSQPYNNPWLDYLPLAISTPAFGVAPVVKGGSSGLFGSLMGPLTGALGWGIGSNLVSRIF